MRLRTRALLAILLILLPSGSDTASLYLGGLNIPEVEEGWSHLSISHPRRPDQFDDFDTFGDAIGSQESNFPAVATPSSHQQREAHVGFPSSSSALATDPAHGYQAQADPSPPWLRGMQDEFLQKNLANLRRDAQRRVTRAQQEVRQVAPQSRPAAQVFGPGIGKKFADLEVIDGVYGLFGRIVERRDGTDFFRAGTPIQQAWILKRFQEQSGRGGSWSNEEPPLGAMPYHGLVKSINIGDRFNPPAKRPALKPYIVDNHLIYFKRQEGSGLPLCVFAIPFNGKAAKPVTGDYTITFIGQFRILAGLIPTKSGVYT